MAEQVDLGTVVYWGFQTSLLGLVGVACWQLKEIRSEIRQERRVGNWLRGIVLSMHTRCAMLHPEKPMPPIPDDPGSSE